MRPTLRGFAALALLVPALAATSATPPLTLQPGSVLWIEGTSTVRGFKCESTALTLSAQGGPDAAAQVLKGEKAVQSISLSLPSASLDCKNGTMNGHMRKALKTTEHATISFTVTHYTLGANGDATVTGTLTLAGVTKPMTVPVTLAATANGGLRATGQTEVRMTQHGLTPPTLMMGTMKVHETVVVRFDLRFGA